MSKYNKGDIVAYADKWFTGIGEVIDTYYKREYRTMAYKILDDSIPNSFGTNKNTRWYYERDLDFTDKQQDNTKIKEPKKVEEKKMDNFKVVKVIQNIGKDTTVVFFMDGSLVKVKREESRPNDIYNAVASAIAIKAVGSNTALKKIVSKTEYVNVPIGEVGEVEYSENVDTVEEEDIVNNNTLGIKMQELIEQLYELCNSQDECRDCGKCGKEEN